MTDAKETLGLYIHIPFCLKKCLYCDFYSGESTSSERASYIEALCAHLRAWGETAAGYGVDTVYLGGGTPTMLSGEELCRILDTVRAVFCLQSGAEITVECNPATVNEKKAEALLAAGVNRVSIGAQSLAENELRALGRHHTTEDFLHTVGGLKAAGFENISADLMLGIPEQTRESLARTLEGLLALDLQHISAYGLRVEEGTPFFDMRHRLALPSEDAEADMQEMTCQTLREAGFVHYEISNYAKPGRESRHNLRYWKRLPYLGFGPGAHSFFEGVRFETPPDRAGYLAAVREGDLARLRTAQQRIFGKEAMDEYVMLRMRLAEGVDEADFAHRFGASLREVYSDFDAEPLVHAGFMTAAAGRLAFTERGFLVSNAILSDWLDFGRGEA